MLSYPPNERSGRMSHCGKNIISECNVTGRWDNYDEKISKACTKSKDSENAVFRSIDPTRLGDTYLYFSSVYCYLCNEPKSSMMKDECKVENPYSTVRVTNIIRLFGEIARPEEQEKKNVQEYICNSVDVWDPYSVSNQLYIKIESSVLIIS
jgi:hypothetical protein